MNISHLAAISVIRMRTFAILSLIVALGFFAGCRSTVPTGEKLQTKQDPVEGMVFLTFMMRNDSISGKEIKLISKIIIAQRLKSNPVDATDPSRLIISQIDNFNKVLSVTAVDHPLLRRVEFADDDGKFQSRNLTLKEAEFAVRVTLYHEAEYIQVVEELSGEAAYTTKFKIRD